MMPPLRTLSALFCLALAVPMTRAEGLTPPAKALAPAASTQAHSALFWLWHDVHFENPKLLLSELEDIRKAGFDMVYAMPRGTRYQLHNPEMDRALKVASEACSAAGIRFVWGPDPRLAASEAVRRTGRGAEILLTTAVYNQKPGGKGATRAAHAETRVEAGRYSLRFEYLPRRDVHLLADVSLALNPTGVERVYAYELRNGKVVPGSLRDLTASAHFFVNRSFNYVEVFGEANLPEGDWRVIAFPRFGTNLFDFGSPAHEEVLSGLLDRYHSQGIKLDGLWWDEPGYYLQYGQYLIGDKVYADFKARFGYELRDHLHALLLDQEDGAQLRVRDDYFRLIGDYVLDAERRFWERGERSFGRLRMGIHHSWHSIPDNLYHGSADYWRGVSSVDAGYTDDARFENYFTQGLDSKFEQVSYLVLASSLAKFSRSGEAWYNRWGVNYEAPVPRYWNDLMQLWSCRWLQHAYGNTGVIGATRNFGPGFPNHSTWPLLPELNARARQVHEVTGLRLPAADVAVVCPLATFRAGHEPGNDELVRSVNRLVGALPAAGVQVDFISDDFLAEAVLANGVLQVRGQSYKALVLPGAEVVSKAVWAKLQELRAAAFPVVFVDNLPSRLVEGPTIAPLGDKTLQFSKLRAEDLPGALEALRLPSPVGRLPGAYVTALREDGSLLVLIMPITPGTTVTGSLSTEQGTLAVAPTQTLAIYRVSKGNSTRVFPNP